ncbi:MAG: amidohydrolase [Acetobacteraceae bacterium]|nr:amidohydrolase [Acetobacteraceae bacterium]
MAEGLAFFGRIYTADSDRPRVEALAAWEGRVQVVGRTDEVLEAARCRGCELVDLGSGCLVPGLVDAHVHLLAYCLRRQEVDLSGLESAEAAAARVARSAALLPPGEWIRGGGWDKNRWGDAFPGRELLDAAAPGHPVCLFSKDCHAVWVNSRALELAGVGAATPDPEGGRILRRKGGEPSGVLLENAVRLVTDAMAEPSAEACAAALERGLPGVWSRGLVGVHDCEGPEALRAFQDLESRGRLALRVLMHLPAEHLACASRLALRSGLGSEFLRVGGIKIFADGTLGSQTAELLEPYEGRPGYRGLPIQSPEELDRLVAEAAEAGFTVAIHAIGDGAVRRALDAIQAHPAAPDPGRPKNRIEHAQLIHPDDLPRFARLGVVASMQPLHCPSDRPLAERYWGSRCCLAYPWRSLLESGAVLAFGSDAPVEDIDPLAGISAAIRRRLPAEGGPAWHPEQCLSLPQALSAYTVGPAVASGGGASRGRLAVGQAADFVALSHDIMALRPEELASVRVVITVVGGRVVYAAGGGAGE